MMTLTNEGYQNLTKQILFQTVVDYTLAVRAMKNGRSNYTTLHNYKSCQDFFKEPPYDYGDIDLKQVQKLCEEKAHEPGRLFAGTLWKLR